MKMKTVASFLSAAVALGLAAGALPGSAIAAKKEKKAEAPKARAPELSKEFRAAAAGLQAAAGKKDVAGLEGGLAAATPLAKAPDELFFLGNYTFELAKLKNDNALLRKGIDMMIDANSPLAANREQLLSASAQAAYQAGDYQAVLNRTSQLDQMGSKNVNRFLLGAEANFKLNRFGPGLALLGRGVAEGKAAATPAAELDSWVKRGLSQALKSKDPALVSTWSHLLVQTSPTKTNWRDALIVFRDAGKLDKAAQLDIARLMMATNSLAGERDFFDYAALALENKFPWEAKSAIESGKSSGAVPATSKPIAERLAEANAMLGAETAAIAADAKKAATSGTAVYATNVANALIAQGEFGRALDLLKVAEGRAGADMTAVSMLRGIALTRMGQKEDAKASFAKITSGPRAEIARFWTLFLDQGAPTI